MSKIKDWFQGIIIAIILISSIIYRKDLEGHGIMAWLYWFAIIGAAVGFIAYRFQIYLKRKKYKDQ